MDRTTAYGTTPALALPERAVALPARQAGPAAGAEPGYGSAPAPVVRDLRERGGRSPHGLIFGPRDVVVVTGLPGSGKSTLMRRAVGAGGTRVDSQDTRDRWDARAPASSRTPSTVPSSGSPTTRVCGARSAPAAASSCTTAARRAGSVPGSPGRPAGAAAPCTC